MSAIVPVPWCTLHSNWNLEPRYLLLCDLLGNFARSLPCDLWSFCTRAATDGDLSGYNATQLARSLGYDGPDPVKMLGALKDADYLTKNQRVVGWHKNIFKLAEHFRKKARIAGLASAEVRRTKAAAAKKSKSDPSSDPDEITKDQEERRGELGVEPWVQLPVPSSVSFIPLFLTAPDRTSIASENKITEEGINRALEDFNADRRSWFKQDGNPDLAGFRVWLKKAAGKQICALFPRTGKGEMIADEPPDWRSICKRARPDAGFFQDESITWDGMERGHRAEIRKIVDDAKKSERFGKSALPLMR